jgi:hypothetical protein
MSADGFENLEIIRTRGNLPPGAIDFQKIKQQEAFMQSADADFDLLSALEEEVTPEVFRNELNSNFVFLYKDNTATITRSRYTADEFFASHGLEYPDVADETTGFFTEEQQRLVDRLITEDSLRVQPKSVKRSRMHINFLYEVEGSIVNSCIERLYIYGVTQAMAEAEKLEDYEWALRQIANPGYLNRISNLHNRIMPVLTTTMSPALSGLIAKASLRFVEAADDKDTSLAAADMLTSRLLPLYGNSPHFKIRTVLFSYLPKENTKTTEAVKFFSDRVRENTGHSIGQRAGAKAVRQVAASSEKTPELEKPVMKSNYYKELEQELTKEGFEPKYVGYLEAGLDLFDQTISEIANELESSTGTPSAAGIIYRYIHSGEGEMPRKLKVKKLINTANIFVEKLRQRNQLLNELKPLTYNESDPSVVALAIDRLMYIAVHGLEFDKAEDFRRRGHCAVLYVDIDSFENTREIELPDINIRYPEADGLKLNSLYDYSKQGKFSARELHRKAISI